MAAVNVVQDRLSAENKSFPAVLVETQMRYFQTFMESKESIPPVFVAWRAGKATLFLLGPSPH
jgi:hypothetical protein